MGILAKLGCTAEEARQAQAQAGAQAAAGGSVVAGSAGPLTGLAPYTIHMGVRMVVAQEEEYR